MIKINNKVSNKCLFELLVIVVVLMVLGGCQLPQVEPSTPPEISKASQAAETYSQIARELEQKGALHEAYLRWQIVSTIVPTSIEAQTNISRLQHQIQNEANYYLRAAQGELARDRHSAAESLLLNALAVSPDDPHIISQLQEVRRVLALTKIAKQPKKVKFKKTDDLSVDEMFELGLSLMSSDKEKAKKMFESILKINPAHLAARAYLEVLAEN